MVINVVECDFFVVKVCDLIGYEFFFLLCFEFGFICRVGCNFVIV